MNFRQKLQSIVLALALCLSLTGTAIATDYDEATDGDLSGDGLSPTAITLTAGNNTVTATSIAGDVEYVFVTIPANHKIDSVMLDAYTSPDGVAFAAVQSGSTFTEPISGADVANLLGYSHFGPSFNHVGTDILDDMGSGQGAIGFSGPLVASEYTFWMQQTGSDSTTYTLDFVVSELAPTPLEVGAEPGQFMPRIFVPIFGR